LGSGGRSITSIDADRVLFRRLESRGRPEADTGARFAIDGSIRKDPAAIKVAVQLIDMASTVQIGGDMHESDLAASQIIAFQEKVARRIAAKICGELGIVARAMSIESRNVPPSDLKTYEAMLRYYAFIADFTNRGRGLVEQYIKFDDILEYKTTLANFSSSLAEMCYSLMIWQIWSQKVFSDII